MLSKLVNWYECNVVSPVFSFSKIAPDHDFARIYGQGVLMMKIMAMKRL